MPAGSGSRDDSPRAAAGGGRRQHRVATRGVAGRAPADHRHAVADRRAGPEDAGLRHRGLHRAQPGSRTAQHRPARRVRLAHRRGRPGVRGRPGITGHPRRATPVRELGRAARLLGQGELRTRITVHGSDELAEVAHTFNNTAAELERHVKQLREMEADARRFVA
ncbi:HAMP domain-containing protein, partial [Nonomuraea angiospora]|uniref:HAMP domain-containing protein n=1 Tax=Nonomuraea angiospora TaxID=46172 RepID=UPI003323FC3F